MARAAKSEIQLVITLMTMILSTLCAVAGGKTIYVDSDAEGANNGSSWANAYMFLQDALADANDSQKPVEIRVAQGTYTPDCGRGYVRGDKGAKFFLKSGVTLKGGFAGAGADDPDAWDAQTYETVLSGDLSGNDERLLENFIENSDHVIWCIEEDANAVLDGFTITGGYATDRIGGGLLNYGANPTIIQCVFFDNYASQGGGMANRYSSPTVSDCTFSGNLVRYGGGAMYNTDQSHPIVESCIFHDNWSTILGGGGMYCGDSNPTVVNCLFIENGAPFGGGMYNAAASPIITNCTFSNNRVNAWGGGMQNEAGAQPIITNCILWDNTPDQITTFGSFPGQDAEGVTYCDIQGGHAGEGNIDADPLFANPGSGDYHLKSQAGRWDLATKSWVVDDVTSPCIDAGNPNHPDAAAFEPDPSGGRINIGAYGGTAKASKSPSFMSEENFESYDFSTFPWEHYGNASWIVTSYEKNSGIYSAQSGSIDHDENTTLQVRLECGSGDITFYRKISSEENYDFLEFYIDGEKRGEWSGTTDWDRVSFPVTTGIRTFKWTYSKDGSVSEDDDTAWIDDIVFPTGVDTDAFPPNPAAAYLFEADADDSSGNGLDGMLLGDAHVAHGVLVLDGEDDAVAIPGIGNDLTEFSFSMKVFPTVDVAPLKFSGGINTDSWIGGVHFKLKYGIVNVGVHGLAGHDVVGTSIVEPDKWTHLALTVSPTEVAVYVNGEKENSRVGRTVPAVNVGAASIGAWNNSGTDIQREMTGMIDDVLIYNRTLSEAEIRYLANN